MLRPRPAGTEKRRKQAEMYIRLVMAQRLGPVHLEDESTPDLTIVHVRAARRRNFRCVGGTPKPLAKDSGRAVLTH